MDKGLYQRERKTVRDTDTDNWNNKTTSKIRVTFDRKVILIMIEYYLLWY